MVKINKPIRMFGKIVLPYKFIFEQKSNLRQDKKR
jgi:hypothetical protein